MTVYIVQEVLGRNLVPAQKYGELVPLLPARANLMLSTGPEVKMLKRKLIDFNEIPEDLENISPLLPLLLLIYFQIILYLKIN